MLFNTVHRRCPLKDRVRLRHASPDNCSKCPPGFGVASACTKTADTECVACTQGLSYSPHNSYRKPCYPCSRCGAGLYVARPCTLHRDTLCDACSNGQRGPNSSDFYAKCVTQQR